MLLSGAYHRVLRFAALATWALLGLPVILGFLRHKYHGFSSHDFTLWLLAFAVFGPALWLSSQLPAGRSQPIRIVALAFESVAALSMIYLLPGYFLGFLLVIVSWQLALFFSKATAILWAVLQTLVLLWIYAPTCDFGWGWAATGSYVGFQAFAMITAFVARSEATLRQDLGRTNAELQATRELLAESARGAERVKISGELHDLLGHQLTALNLHLEVARHKATPAVEDHIGQAQDISKDMLKDLRGVVGALSHSENIDVCRALDALTREVPLIEIHLTYPDHLHIEDTWKAQVLLRCVQEIITNALKHSGAQNLWITIAPASDGLEISARDDGRGSLQAAPGIGLSSMKRRLEDLGGRLHFESPPKAGFRISAWIPLGAEGTA
jgi:signal transduction histidine kinase